MEIWIANFNDIKGYTNLLQETYQEAYVDESIGLVSDCFSREIFEHDDTQKYLKSHLVENDLQKTWLAFDGDVLIGAITSIIKNDNEAELTGFYVRPEYQCRGIGKRLYDLALKFVGDRDLILDIYAHNIKTIEMYKKWGWELDVTRGEKGFFTRHWLEWPDKLKAKCMYMRLKNK